MSWLREFFQILQRLRWLMEHDGSQGCLRLLLESPRFFTESLAGGFYMFHFNSLKNMLFFLIHGNSIPNKGGMKTSWNMLKPPTKTRQCLKWIDPALTLQLHMVAPTMQQNRHMSKTIMQNHASTIETNRNDSWIHDNSCCVWLVSDPLISFESSTTPETGTAASPSVKESGWG